MSSIKKVNSVVLVLVAVLGLNLFGKNALNVSVSFGDALHKPVANQDARYVQDHKSIPKYHSSEHVSNVTSHTSTAGRPFPTIHSDKDLYMLGGYRAEVEQLADLVRYVQNPENFLASGVAAPKGVILSGPPGVGKSFLAEAIAGHAGVPLIMVGSGELESSIVSGQELRLKSLFEQAEQMAPCVICLDEFEAIASKRMHEEAANQGHMPRVNSAINQLLTLLAREHPGVVVIATTNHYDSLDPAIVRPGRFDRHIPLSLPDKNDRKLIFDKYVEHKKLADDVSLDDLASLTAGFSGAKIAALVNEAVRAADKDHSDRIYMSHFDRAWMSLCEGIVAENHQDAESKLLLSAHESGHALVGHLLGRRIYKVSLLPSGGSLGRTMFTLPESYQNITKDDLGDEICMVLAGRAAEIIMQAPSVGSSSDLRRAKSIANEMLYQEAMGESILGSSGEVEQILQFQMARAIRILEENRATWEHLRDSLVEQDEVLRPDFLKLVRGERLPPKSRVAEKKALDLPPKAKSKSP